jgi:RNA polymerase sigma-70 factor, ECF subfamily
VQGPRVQGPRVEATDVDLARRVAATAGDAAAEAELWRRFGKRAFLYGLRHLGRDAAADLAQEAFLIVIEALRAGRVEDPERIASFVLGTCRLVAFGMHRRERRRRDLAARLPLDEIADMVPSCDTERLQECVGRLPAREQRLVAMTFQEDRSADEIGGALGMTPGHVRVLRHRTLLRLRECLESRGEP